MKTPRLWIALCALALVAAGALTAVAAGAGKARPTAVAVVDIEKTFNSLQEKVQLEADLNTKNQNLVKEKDEREKELKTLKGELDILNASNPGFKKKQEELEKKYYDLQSWMQWQNASLLRENRLQITQLYNKILASTEKVAKEAGFDVVLFKEPAADFSNVDPKELTMALRSRKVLYAAGDLEITDQVITAMNNEYKNIVR